MRPGPMSAEGYTEPFVTPHMRMRHGFRCCGCGACTVSPWRRRGVNLDTLALQLYSLSSTMTASALVGECDYSPTHASKSSLVTSPLIVCTYEYSIRVSLTVRFSPLVILTAAGPFVVPRTDDFGYTHATDVCQ